VLRSHGRFGLDRALGPAIRYAECGFPVASRIAYDWSFSEQALRADPGASRHFLVGGRAPAAGEIMRFPALAATLKAVAALGPKAFYEEAATEIVATLRRAVPELAGWFANHRGEEVTPVSSTIAGSPWSSCRPAPGLVTFVLLISWEFRPRLP
jgi:gamma-glutamyltranspeptidase/glutathione hydrolase